MKRLSHQNAAVYLKGVQGVFVVIQTNVSAICWLQTILSSTVAHIDYDIRKKQWQSMFNNSNNNNDSTLSRSKFHIQPPNQLGDTKLII